MSLSMRWGQRRNEISNLYCIKIRLADEVIAKSFGEYFSTVIETVVSKFCPDFGEMGIFRTLK